MPVTSEIFTLKEDPRDVFGDRDMLMLALFDELTARIGNAMTLAYRAEAAWVDGVRAALCELLAFLDANPTLARLLLVESRAGGIEMLVHRGRVLDALACALEADSPPAPAGSLPAPFGSAAILGAVLSVLHARLAQESTLPTSALSGTLMSVIVLPYLGADAAREELLRPPSTRGPGGELDLWLQ